MTVSGVYFMKGFGVYVHWVYRLVCTFLVSSPEFSIRVMQLHKRKSESALSVSISK